MLCLDAGRASALREWLTTFTFSRNFTLELCILSLNFTLLTLGLWHTDLSWVVGRLKWERKLLFRYRLKVFLVVYMGLFELAREH